MEQLSKKHEERSVLLGEKKELMVLLVISRHIIGYQIEAKTTQTASN